MAWGRIHVGSGCTQDKTKATTLLSLLSPVSASPLPSGKASSQTRFPLLSPRCDPLIPPRDLKPPKHGPRTSRCPQSKGVATGTFNSWGSLDSNTARCASTRASSRSIFTIASPDPSLRSHSPFSPSCATRLVRCFAGTLVVAGDESRPPGVTGGKAVNGKSGVIRQSATPASRPDERDALLGGSAASCTLRKMYRQWDTHDNARLHVTLTRTFEWNTGIPCPPKRSG